MNNKLPISCFIIAQDESDRITNTIKSVIDFVDEVIVIDSGSTDGTQELAKQLGCKVFSIHGAVTVHKNVLEKIAREMNGCLTLMQMNIYLMKLNQKYYKLLIIIMIIIISSQ